MVCRSNINSAIQCNYGKSGPYVPARHSVFARYLQRESHRNCGREPRGAAALRESRLLFDARFQRRGIASETLCGFFSSGRRREGLGLFQQLRASLIDHYQLEKRYFRRDGSLVWGSLSISLLKSRPSPLVLAMVEDITAKKTAEEARFRHARSSNPLKTRSFPRIWTALS